MENRLRSQDGGQQPQEATKETNNGEAIRLSWETVSLRPL